ncbi:MAG: hybrid sensor histidine kinase/response regulator [Planctomycetota bacterium]|nr:hybrid sensor histidine kinase/response regulator [Planctomycetota bacterium]
MEGSSPNHGVSEAEPTQSAGRRAAHVLVVDDKQVVRDFLREVMQIAGHRVTSAENGQVALESCRRDPPQVVLTDLHMSPMGGQELIAALREEMPQIVCVVLTGYGTVERTVELMRLGAFDVLTKPCRADEITATIEKALEHHKALSTNTDLRKRLQVQEKLAMIGKLAAGVAHELNNPLDATLRCVRLTQDRVKEDPEALEYLDLAHAGLLRMADIVQSLLTFSRNAAVEQAPQPLAALVEESLASVRLALGDEAPELCSDLRADVSEAAVPRGMHQVLTNLLRNACDAAGGGTPITVRAMRNNNELLIEVEDLGPGIDEEVLPRVFEPFFTTKEPGKGTGLGLPISARLVEKFGGRIRVECPTAGGTIVTIALPAARYLAEAV